MADAREEQILAAITTAVTGLTTTGTNVFRGRSYPLDANDLPGLLVFMGPDTLQQELTDTNIDWFLGVGIEAYVQTTSTVVDTKLAKIRKEVHTAIMTTPGLGLSFVIDTRPISAAEPEVDGDGAKPTARRRLEFIVHYRTSRTDISA